MELFLTFRLELITDCFFSIINEEKK